MLWYLHRAVMHSYVIKPTDEVSRHNLLRFLKQNQYRFVFYAYGTNEQGIPHHKLHVHTDNPHKILMVEITLSEYILRKL